ncbi:MAG: hypothetical protein FJZ01_27960 [Candidatus Sericytochromatia bacterium]|nr:hypothetical protein [Candidatus Tanganyikabacteria bacterium]
MPLSTRVFIKTGLAYLVATLLLGAIPALGGGYSPGYVHGLTLGWTAQLIFGVAFWLFPLPPGKRPPLDERMMWATYALLNAGLLARIVAEPRASAGGTWGLVLAAGACAMFLSAALFAAVMWPRCRAIR